MTVQFIVAVDILYQKTRYGWVMTHVLHIVLGAVAELSLQCLAKKRIERLLLATTHVHRADREGNAQLQAFNVIRGLTCAFQVDWRKSP